MMLPNKESVILKIIKNLKCKDKKHNINSYEMLKQGKNTFSQLGCHNGHIPKPGLKSWNLPITGQQANRCNQENILT